MEVERQVVAYGRVMNDLNAVFPDPVEGVVGDIWGFARIRGTFFGGVA